MKKRVLLSLIIVTISFLSCKKDSTPSGIVGEWELRTSINGMTGAQTNYQPGNGTILKFSENTYERYSNGQFIKSGVYNNIRDTSILLSKVSERIIYDGEINSVRSFVEIEKNRMTIWMDAYDAGSMSYERRTK